MYSSTYIPGVGGTELSKKKSAADDNLPNLDECRYLILKIVEQSVRDYLSLEHSKAPIDQTYYQTAYDFIFLDDYRIPWGPTTKCCTDLLDYIGLDIDWFRTQVHRVKKKKVKELDLKALAEL